MRKLFACLILAVSVCLGASAQSVACHFGVQGGVTLAKLQDLQASLHGAALPGWHAGATFELKLPAYFSIQPSVNFEQSRTKLPQAAEPSNLNINCINVPLALQWGPDLGVVRLYAQAVPFVDFMLGGGCTGAWNPDWGQVKDNLRKAQFGVGVGGGLEFWRIQMSFRYNWGFGNWSAVKEGSPLRFDSYRRQGWTVTLAYLFL